MYEEKLKNKNLRHLINTVLGEEIWSEIKKGEPNYNREVGYISMNLWAKKVTADTGAGPYVGMSEDWPFCNYPNTVSTTDDVKTKKSEWVNRKKNCNLFIEGLVKSYEINPAELKNLIIDRRTSKDGGMRDECQLFTESCFTWDLVEAIKEKEVQEELQNQEIAETRPRQKEAIITDEWEEQFCEEYTPPEGLINSTLPEADNYRNYACWDGIRGRNDNRWGYVPVKNWDLHEKISGPLEERPTMIQDSNKLEDVEQAFASTELKAKVAAAKYREENWKRSPFGLLQNIEEFGVVQGGYVIEMLRYGIEVKACLNEESTTGRTTSYSSKARSSNIAWANAYLRKQYIQLAKYRDQRDSMRYWKKALYLMKFSSAYHLATINQWQPTWYKKWDVKTLRKMILRAQEIVAKNEVSPPLKRVWIQSPYPKWRALSVPPLGWRLALRMWSDMLAFWLEPVLDKEVYHGFMYGRGTKTWWTNVIDSGLLEAEKVYEFDLSSFFHQVSRKEVYRALLETGGLPNGVANYILGLVTCTTKDKPFNELPALDAKVERIANETWAASNRGLPMGIGLSPLLGLITMHTVFQEIGFFKEKGITLRAYADDASLFIEPTGMQFIKKLQEKYCPLAGENEVAKIINSIPAFRKAGIYLDQIKSGWVKEGHWLRDYKALGLEYTGASTPENPTLVGATRGRPPSPTSPGREPSKLKLDWPAIQEWKKEGGTEKINSAVSALTDAKRYHNLDLSLLKSLYPKMFGTVMARLYCGAKDLNITQDFSIKEKSGSLVDRLLGSVKGGRLRWMYKRLNINTFTLSSWANQQVLPLMSKRIPTAIQENSLLNGGIQKSIEKEGWLKTQKKLSTLGAWNSITIKKINRENEAHETINAFFVDPKDATLEKPAPWAISNTWEVKRADGPQEEPFYRKCPKGIENREENKGGWKTLIGTKSDPVNLKNLYEIENFDIKDVEIIMKFSLEKTNSEKDFLVATEREGGKKWETLLQEATRASQKWQLPEQALPP